MLPPPGLLASTVHPCTLRTRSSWTIRQNAFSTRLSAVVSIPASTKGCMGHLAPACLWLHPPYSCSASTQFKTRNILLVGAKPVHRVTTVVDTWTMKCNYQPVIINMTVVPPQHHPQMSRLGVQNRRPVRWAVTDTPGMSKKPGVRGDCGGWEAGEGQKNSASGFKLPSQI